MRKLAVIILLNLISLPAIPEQTLTTPNYDPNIPKAIKVLNSELSDDRVIRLSQIVGHYSQEYGIDYKIVLAILKQESNFDVKAINYEARDFGIGQMHYKTIKDRHIDLGSLLTDEIYAIKETYKFLYELKLRYAKIDSKLGQKWFTRYHSCTPYFRSNYATLLKNHIAKVEGILNGRSNTRTAELRDHGPRVKKADSKAALRRTPMVGSRDL